MLIDISDKNSEESEFLWPTWGGTNLNQQRTTNSPFVRLSPSNVDQLESVCSYIADGSQTMYGFATIYRAPNEQLNAVFADYSGFVTNLDIDDCSVNWRVRIRGLFNDSASADATYITRNGLSLFRLADGTEGVVFGTPNGDGGRRSLATM